MKDPRNTVLRLPMGQCRAPDGQSSGVEIYLEIQSGNTAEMQPSLGKKGVVPVFSVTFLWDVSCLRSLGYEEDDPHCGDPLGKGREVRI